MVYNYSNLNPGKALIWRIVHRDNLPWILDNGLYCGNSTVKCPTWVSIGNSDLIDKRSRRPVPLAPNGFLNDYVPFYFTPFSVMMLNINSGRGVTQRSNEEIIILVSSLPHISNEKLPFLFTDSHAYQPWANYYQDLKDLDKIDWPLLQARDFKRDVDNPANFERYQAETLIHKHCPTTGLLGIVCYTEPMKVSIEKEIKDRSLNLEVFARREWYF